MATAHIAAGLMIALALAGALALAAGATASDLSLTTDAGPGASVGGASSVEICVQVLTLPPRVCL